MSENDATDVTEQKKAELPPCPDRWDWDADLGEPPPPLRRGKIRVQFRFKASGTDAVPYSGGRSMSGIDLLEHAEQAKTIQPSPVCEEDIEKDDVSIPKPPSQRSGTILVHLKYGGRRKPIPVDFPDTDDVECSRRFVA